jgi:sporadic carbohydrate cluster protein (TIGR04323 family)
MLPVADEERRAIYDKVLAQNSELHFAVEDMTVRSEEDVERLEDIWLIQKLMSRR